jgi:hypothetical protein
MSSAEISAPGAPLLKGLDAKSIRHGFVQKVYGILGCQLTLTTVIGATIMYYGQTLLRTNPSLVWAMFGLSLAMSVGIMLVFMCCPETMRRSPINHVLLLLFTLAESVMVGFACIGYTTQSVLIVLGMTAVVVVALTLFACQTKYDFTGMGPYLFCGMMVLCAFSFAMMLASMCGLGGSGAFETVRLMYAAGGALLFSCYIVYDTQLIIGQKHQMQFEIDDYAMAAIALYLDIIQLFLFLLRLFGERR